MKIQRAGVLAGVAVAGLGLLVAAGCAGYANYPPLRGDTAINNPNVTPMTDIMVSALSWTLERYPPNQPFAVNLPKGMDPDVAGRLLERLEDPNANLMTRETMGLPTFHIARVWIRGTKAEVDVQRPILTLQSPSGGAAHQTMELTLEGGWQAWRVSSVKTWAIGAIPTPAPNFIGEKAAEEQTAEAAPESDVSPVEDDDSGE
ncbi:MAG: hypothetical protein VYC34_04855 [Planctomycetota bacterium]|nr:hypothetical protein [Planctomycetota bacterium]